MSLLGTINPNISRGHEPQAGSRLSWSSVGSQASPHDSSRLSWSQFAEHTARRTSSRLSWTQLREEDDPPARDGDWPIPSNADYNNQIGNAALFERFDALDKRISLLARQLAQHSIIHPPEDAVKNTFTDISKDSPLNPHGSNFDPRAWVQNALAIQSRDPDRYPQRTAGIAFRNLGVYGFGSPTDYQKDVFNAALSLGSLARGFGNSGKKKIQILDGFDGLVESGEMLVVLGRPGR